jgi:hypothetical protein
MESLWKTNGCALCEDELHSYKKIDKKGDEFNDYYNINDFQIRYNNFKSLFYSVVIFAVSR